MLKKIEKILAKIDDGTLYSADTIFKYGVVTNTKLEPSLFTFYRLVRRGKLPSVNLGTGGSPRYFVKGVDLRKYIADKFQLIN